MTFHCPCDGDFCIKHKDPDAHYCHFDFKENNKKELEAKMPKTNSSKITKIS